MAGSPWRTSHASGNDRRATGGHHIHKGFGLQNLTAGPTSIRQFFTLTTPLGPNSTIYSAFPLASPFGRAIAYTALFEGKSCPIL